MDFFDALVRLETDLWNLVDSELTKRGQVRLALLHALRLLDRLGGNGRVQDLSEGLSITIGAASKLVDRLEHDGTVLRAPNPTDRRSSLIGLTASGESALFQGDGIVAAALERCLEPPVATDAELAAATALLHRLTNALRPTLEQAGVEA